MLRVVVQAVTVVAQGVAVDRAAAQGVMVDQAVAQGVTVDQAAVQGVMADRPDRPAHLAPAIPDMSIALRAHR